MKPFGLPLISAATETLSGIYISGSPRSNTMSVVSPQGKLMGTAANPSITMFQSKSRKPYPGSPFTGGGLTLPWGIAVDGDDTVWVFNFGAAKVGTSTDIATGISRFCGVTTSNCPPGLRVGDPISPGLSISESFYRAI